MFHPRSCHLKERPFHVRHALIFILYPVPKLPLHRLPLFPLFSCAGAFCCPVSVFAKLPHPQVWSLHRLSDTGFPFLIWDRVHVFHLTDVIGRKPSVLPSDCIAVHPRLVIPTEQTVHIQLDKILSFLPAEGAISVRTAPI